ncbi:hypothetical protein [Tateyamaria sp.]|uniref:hypothetical protein n=1 Tax=Tateyamaria sp. TaxID=1929288 RepID=UPI00329B1428
MPNRFIRPLKFLAVSLCMSLSSIAPTQAAERTIIGVDISGSSTFTTEQHSADEAARYVSDYVLGLESMPHDLMLVSLGDAGLAQRAVDVRVTLSNRRATSPRRMGPQFGSYLSAIPGLMASGQLEEDGSTSLLSFLRSLEPVCGSSNTPGDTRVMLFTDGIEWSDEVQGRGFLDGHVSLPAPTRPFLDGCAVEMHGLGQLRADRNAAGLEERLIPVWRDWLTAAGADEVKVTGSFFNF